MAAVKYYKIQDYLLLNFFPDAAGLDPVSFLVPISKLNLEEDMCICSTKI